MWYKTQEFPSPEQPTQPLVDQVVEPISNFVDPTLLSESDPNVIEPMSSLVNPTLPSKSEFHEAVESIPSPINATLLLESEVSNSHVFFTASVTERNSYGLGYHNRQIDSKNQSIPICKRKKMHITLRDMKHTLF